jgi:type III pantothenate kinase
MLTSRAMRLGVVDVGNTRVKRAVWDGRRLRPYRGGAVEAWVGARVGRAEPPPGTLLLGRDFPPLVRNRTRTPETVGADRLAQASAAWHRTRGACVVVGMGTAITVDVVNGRGDFLGGLIAPGLRMMARALHEGTARLPEVEPRRTRSALGRDTIEALQCGVSTAAEGLIRRALAAHRGRVFGTGGDAPAFRDLFDVLAPDLALEGVVRAYLCSRSS